MNKSRILIALILTAQAGILSGAAYGIIARDLNMALNFNLLLTVTYPLTLTLVAGIYLKKKKEELMNNPLDQVGNIMSGMNQGHNGDASDE